MLLVNHEVGVRTNTKTKRRKRKAVGMIVDTAGLGQLP
jgi:hypothetical protein